MTARGWRPCLYPLCGALVVKGYCARHRRAAPPRAKTTERGYDAAHVQWRRLILARDVYCVDPEQRHPHERRVAVVADHIVPLRFGGGWKLDNGQGLCPSCHAAKTVGRDGGFRNPRRA